MTISDENGFCEFCDMWEYFLDDIFLTIDPQGKMKVSLFSNNNQLIWC